MIRLGPDDPPFTAWEAARIIRITGTGMMRGNLTSAQKRDLDGIVKKARKRQQTSK